MAFLFPNKKPDELTDLEIIEDVLLTQNKIEQDLRDALALIKEEKYGKRVMGFYSVALSGQELCAAFTKAYIKYFRNCDKELFNIDSDMSQAWVKFEHFQFSEIKDCVMGYKLGDGSSRWMREKYACYNKCVMPYYDFFKLTPEEKLSKLTGKNKAV